MTITYKKWTYAYDGNGNVKTVTNNVTNDVKVFEYDNNDNVKKETIGGRIIQYEYDNTNELASIAVQSNGKNFSQLYQTDSVGRLTHLKRGGASQVSMVYTKTGLVEQPRYVNGVHSNYEYDNAQQLQDMNVTKGTTVLLEESFVYDSDGNLTNVTSSMGNKSYAYDEIDQLVIQTLPNNVTEAYEYDAVGNRTKKTVTTNGESTVFEYGYNANNQLVNANGHSYTYDENGNRTSDDKYEYVYNKFDQLTEIKTLAGKSVATYAYDEEGRRISKTVDGVTTNYHYNQGINVLFETDSQGSITKEYSYDQSGFPLTMTYNNKIYYYILNGQKDVIGLTDSTGAFVAQYEYDAWGNSLSQSGELAFINSLRYKGYHYDEESQLYYLQARYYDAEHGVFLALDPVLGEITDPSTMNGYNYASNDPVMLYDPDGNNPILIVAMAIVRFAAPLLRTGGKSAAKYIAQFAKKKLSPYLKKYIVEVNPNSDQIVKIRYRVVSKGIKDSRIFSLDYHPLTMVHKKNGSKLKKPVWHYHLGNPNIHYVFGWSMQRGYGFTSKNYIIK